MGIVGLLSSIALFVILTIQKWSVPFICLVAGAVIAITSRIPLWNAFFDYYASGFADFSSSWFLPFVSGALFGKCMQDSGMSDDIADVIYKTVRGHSILVILIVSAFLAYGGISTFVIAFTVAPIAISLFEREAIDKRLLPAAILLCPTTVCMTMLPGTPSIQNMIPTQYLGTTIYAAPRFGIAISAVTLLLGYAYLSYKATRLSRKESAPTVNLSKVEDTGQKLPSFLPCILLWTLSFFFIKCGVESRAAVSGALLVASASCILLRGKHMQIQTVINTGMWQGLRTLAITSCIMGYGNIVQSSSAFRFVVENIYQLFDSPLASSILSINVIAAMTGSSTASLQLFFKLFESQISLLNYTPGEIHRIVAVASGGLDSMPYATGVVTATDVVKLDLSTTYIHIFITCGVIPLLALILILIVFL